MELVNEESKKVSLVCQLFGHCRQAFYQSKVDLEREKKYELLLIDGVRKIREEDPRIGARKLWLMLTEMYGRQNLVGRDRFFMILRRNGLMLPPPKPRHTTNSNHRYHKWKNLIKGIELTAPHQLWVADITYISTAEGPCYLHLITDAYSHFILGWELSDTLKASASIKALQMALDKCAHLDIKGLIHHSDRGVQYCCDDYVARLKERGIAISMTEDYNPTDNAIAERVNGIIKTECVYYHRQFNSLMHARNVLENFIRFYNYYRPHMSIGNKTPYRVYWERGPQKNMWQKKEIKRETTQDDEKDLYLPSPTTGRG